MSQTMHGEHAAMRCPSCHTVSGAAELERAQYVCAACGSYFRMPATARIAMLADQGSFAELDRTLASHDPLAFNDSKPYWKRLAEARRETGLTEAVLTGKCAFGGVPAVLVVFDFRFLGGSMGSVVGEKVARAFEKAAKRRLPVVCVAASGGARMQEGMLSLLQMAKVAAAVDRHHRSSMAFISVLTDPTFGGVSASLAFLGDVILAEAGAQIGFVGPRVLQQTSGIAPPEDSHAAERLVEGGLIDCVFPRHQLRTAIVQLVADLRVRRGSKPDRFAKPARIASANSNHTAWDEVQLARHADRPTAADYIAAMTTTFVELHGDRESGDDPAIVGGVAQIDGRPVMVIGHRRGRTAEEQQRFNHGMPMPAGYRKAMRLMRLAAKFELPVLTLVDTPGAQASFDSERRGIAHALARSIALMASLPTPIVCVITGQGGSGGALALAVGDHVLMLEHAVYSVLSPEGAASIVYRDAARASDIAAGLKLRSRDLLRLGIIDAIVSEPDGGAHCNPGEAARLLTEDVCAALDQLHRTRRHQLLKRRYARLRKMGKVGGYWRGVVPVEFQVAFDAFSSELSSPHPAARPAARA